MEKAYELMRMSILAAMPQTFSYVLFALSFIQPIPKMLFQRIALFAVLHSLYTDLMQIVLPLPLHMINSLLAIFVLFILIFRDLTWKQRIWIFVFMNGFAILMDLFMILAAEHLLNIPTRGDWFDERFNEILPLHYAQFLLIVSAAWFIRRRKGMALKRYFSLMIEGDRSTLSKIVSLLVFQFLLLGSMQMIDYSNEKNEALANTITLYLVILVSLLILGLIVRLMIRTRELAVKSTQDVYVEDIHDMFTSIRGQRHDFLNHMQVIHAMAQMGKTEQLKTYVNELVKESRQVNELVNHSSPALAAFVQAKIIVAEGKGIGFTYELPEGWNVPELSVKMIDVIKIIGNLVDNAFDETSKLPPGQRLVHASVKLESGRLVLEVFNQGGILDAKDKERILSPGYTTKGEGHSGLGLAIVQERVKHYNGEIAIRSESAINGTSFKIAIPYSQAIAI